MVFSHLRLSSDICPKTLIVVGALILAGPAQSAFAQFSEPAPTDTLLIASYDDLIHAVDTHNHGIKSALTRSDRVRSAVATYGVLPDPSVSVGVSPFPVHTARGEQVLQVRIEQMLPWPGKRRVQREMAAREAAMGVEEAQRLRAEALLDAVHAAIAIERSEQLMVVTESFRERLERFEDIALSRYETGEGEQQHVWKLQLAMAAQEQALNRLREQREAAVASLQERVHLPVLVPEGAFADQDPSVSKGSAMDRSEVRMFDAGLERARLARDLAGLAERPDWGLSATWMAITESDIPASSDGRDALGLGMMVRIPLGRSEQRAREEVARLQERELQQSRESFLSSWESLWQEQAVHLTSLQDQLRHLDENLMPLAEAMLESSVQAYASGRSGFLDLLDAERSAFELRQQRIELTSRLSMTRWTRLRLSGQWDALPSSDETR